MMPPFAISRGCQSLGDDKWIRDRTPSRTGASALVSVPNLKNVRSFT